VLLDTPAHLWLIVHFDRHPVKAIQDGEARRGKVKRPQRSEDE
jgi:hypothetical protein